jgi:dTDP-4-dehydrorhamnose reductase
MRIVLFGKNGQVGWELQRTLPFLGQVIALDYGDLDLADLKVLETRLDELKPDLIVNASAYTAVDRAESERDLAMKVNGQAPGVMAEAARKSDAMLVHYSTDYVFDGSKGAPYVETDIPNPINEYGRSKLAGEKAIQQAADAYLILRTSWVYSLRLQSGFVQKVLTWARQNEALRIVDDQFGGPTWARMLAEVTALLVAKGGSRPADYFKSYCGVYHLAGDGGATRFEWAEAILAHDPHREEQLAKRLEPALSSEFPTPASRPAYSVLDCERFENTFGIRIPAWKEILQLAMENGSFE